MGFPRARRQEDKRRNKKRKAEKTRRKEGKNTRRQATRKVDKKRKRREDEKAEAQGTHPATHPTLERKPGWGQKKGRNCQKDNGNHGGGIGKKQRNLSKIIGGAWGKTKEI